nr:MAG TPA: hypothetical protein [Caudoviricetes sp.]
MCSSLLMKLHIPDKNLVLQYGSKIHNMDILYQT